MGFVEDGQPYVVPMTYARVEDDVILHGAKESRLMKHLEGGGSVCVCVTILDGLVLARSVTHHSMNFRSVVLFGKGRVIGLAEKMKVLEAFSEKIVPGRWNDARKPNDRELKATSMVAIPIEEASAKMRTGPPVDETDDYDLPVWAGVIPIQSRPGTPVRDPKLGEGVEFPEYMEEFMKRTL
jgi:nitroimidazol reductase NimA-like FMN-containing flavoprotein (pyridoxamine 5'-phosphate oxidase superfamily)